MHRVDFKSCIFNRKFCRAKRLWYVMFLMNFFYMLPQLRFTVLCLAAVRLMVCWNLLRLCQIVSSVFILSSDDCHMVAFCMGNFLDSPDSLGAESLKRNLFFRYSFIFKLANGDCVRVPCSVNLVNSL